LLFKVKDTGIGIAKSHSNDIFERFSQIDSNMNRKYGGTGLGLAICKSIVELMGGKIWFDSEPGKGSTFYFSVPFIMNPEESKKRKLAESNINDTLVPIILVAEDDDSNYMLLSEILMDANAKIERAINGKSAIEKIKKQRYNLVFMDIKMPEMDGLEATREVRTFNTVVPIIAVSAISFPEERKSSMDAGCNDYITKPYDIQVISKLIEKYLG
jgi:CheY-like chemotaxis protein